MSNYSQSRDMLAPLFQGLFIRKHFSNCRVSIHWLLLVSIIGPSQLIASIALGSDALDTQRILGSDLSGRTHYLNSKDDEEIKVFVFLSTECPIAKSYLPTLNTFAQEWNAQGRVKLFGVLSDSSLTRKMARQFAKDYEVSFPVLFDAVSEIAGWLNPTHVPEAFVINADGIVVYRGRIDDVYANIGKRRLAPTTHDVKDAVAATLKGLNFKTPRTQPVGCLFESINSTDEDGAINFNRHIASIVHRRCTSCHREGEVAPFALESYEDVSKRVGQIMAVIEAELMPPWRPTGPMGHFVGDRRLTKSETKLIELWVDDGVPEGKADDLPPLPVFASGWQLGEPDMIVEMPESFSIPADGPDIFQNFVVPLNNKKDLFCVAAEFRPGNAEVVHHSILYLDQFGQARKKDLEDPLPGYATFGGPGIMPTGSVGGWSPGTRGALLPGQLARYVKKGSDLVIQIHYHPTGKAESDKSVVGLHFIEKPKNVVANITLANVAFAIPAGKKEHLVTASYVLPDDVTVVGVTPHMHLLGRSMKAAANLPNGDSLSLIAIDDWHFYWQDQYILSKPIRLPKGTQINIEANYDNSPANPFNPSSPPIDVSYGEETTDEMCYCFFLVATDSPYDLRPVVMDNVRQLINARVKTGVKGYFKGFFKTP